MFDNHLALRYYSILVIDKQGEKAMRKFTAAMLVPGMKLTGYRFSKDYRWSELGWKAFVYRNVDTVQANIWAGIV